MSYNLSVKDIIECTNGKLIFGNEDIICKNFEIDTRKIKENDVFIGIRGTNIDGNALWRQAFESGAKVAILTEINVSKEDEEKYSNRAIIKVKDSIKSIQQIARKKRELYGENFPVIAVTGSVGKTSTKDIIAGVLSKKYKVLKTQGNHNNGLGVPLTILSLHDEEIAVIEMGMNHFGEISELSKIAKPTIAVITNIGTSHIGNLGSRENILKAKLEILDGMKNPKLIINNDNDLLHNWYNEHKQEIEIKTFGIENTSEVFATDIELEENYSYFTCNVENSKFSARVPVGGKHYIYNSLCATTVGQMFNLTNEEIKLGIEQYESAKRRMEIVTIKDNIKIINDSYNASFESMKGAIEVLSNINTGRKIAVLGDMFELGKYAEELHRKVGIEVAKNNIDILICSGENSKYIIEEAIKNGISQKNVYYKNTLNEIKEELDNILQPKDNVLIKASNGMKFYELANKVVSDALGTE